MLKIYKAPFVKLAGGPATVGRRLTTASLYAGTTFNRDHWGDFMPIVTESVTQNAADIDRLMRSVPAWQWKFLESVLAQIEPVPATSWVLNCVLERNWLGRCRTDSASEAELFDLVSEASGLGLG